MFRWEYSALQALLPRVITAYVLVLLTDKIGTVSSKVFKAGMYYITIAMLLINPLYLSILCGFFGGGDMNGISLLVPDVVARNRVWNHFSNQRSSVCEDCFT